MDEEIVERFRLKDWLSMPRWHADSIPSKEPEGMACNNEVWKCMKGEDHEG